MLFKQLDRIVLLLGLTVGINAGNGNCYPNRRSGRVTRINLRSPQNHQNESGSTDSTRSLINPLEIRHELNVRQFHRRNLAVHNQQNRNRFNTICERIEARRQESERAGFPIDINTIIDQLRQEEGYLFAQ